MLPRVEPVPWVGVNDLRPVATAASHLQSLMSELRVKAVGERPAQRLLGVDVQDRRQVRQSHLQRDVVMSQTHALFCQPWLLGQCHFYQ